jgi:hypothetical protein
MKEAGIFESSGVSALINRDWGKKGQSAFYKEFPWTKKKIDEYAEESLEILRAKGYENTTNWQTYLLYGAIAIVGILLLKRFVL